MRDAVKLGLPVSEQDEPVGAGVGVVDHAEAIGGLPHLEYGPDLAVDNRERRDRISPSTSAHQNWLTCAAPVQWCAGRGFTD